MKVFMIGGTGLLGCEAARIFIERGHEVTSVALPPLPEGAPIPQEMKLEMCNIYEKSDDEIRELLKGHDCFVFAAGIDERVEFPAPVYDAYYKYNIAPLKRILPLCKEVGMKSAVGDQGKNDVWSCKGSMGLSWMKSTGIPNIENQITNGSCVIILMGVNDLYNANNYISYINSLVGSVTQKGGKLYFVSVNPTNRSADYLNDDIDAFNLKLKNGL